MKKALALVFALAPMVLGARVGVSEAACIAAGQIDTFADCIEVDKTGDDCLLAFAVDFDGTGTPPIDPKKGTPTKKIECQDGAACDRDGHVNGRCTFHVGVCVNAGGAGCSAPASLVNFDLGKPSVKTVEKKSVKDPEAVYIRQTLVGNVDAILGGSEACTADDLELVVPLKSKKGVCGSPVGQKCTSDQDCDDYCTLSYKKGKTGIKASVDDASSSGDKDSLKFTCLPADPGPAQCTEVFQVASGSDLIGGPLAQGRIGDWMLRNSDVRVLVRDAGRDFSFMRTYGGHILDADLVRDDPADDRDNFMGMQALVHIAATQNTQTVSVLNDGSDCQPGILTTSGPDDLFDVLSPDIAIFSAGNPLSVPFDTAGVDLPLTLTTDYFIRADRPYVQVATTFENLSGSDLELFVGDYLNFGGQTEDFGPGLGFGQPLLRLGGEGVNAPQGLDYLSSQGVGDARGVTYGVVMPRSLATIGINKFLDGTFLTGAFTQSGVTAWVHRQNLVSVLLPQQSAKPPGPFVVPANGTNTLRRWFVVGETVADVTAQREELFGKKLGIIQGTVTSNGAPVADAHVVFVRGDGNRCGFAGGFNCVNVFSSTLTDEFGFYRAFLPAFDYNVQVRATGLPYQGGGSAPADNDVTLKAKKTVTVDVDLPQAAGLRVLIEDQGGSPIAAKVSIVGFEASPDPSNIDSIAGFIDAFGRYFGYDPSEKDGDVFGIAKVLFADHSGDTGTVDIEPGQYHVVVSHGTEYDVYDEIVNVTAGATTTVMATVNQVVDTSGFVSIDTHVHSINSPDSGVPRTDRVVSMLAEGVDFFVASDHDHVNEFSSEISALGAGSLIATAASDEITTFNYGHFNVWPLTVDTNSLTGGALDWGRDGEPAGMGYVANGSYDLLPAEIFASFDPNTKVIQINHFNSGTLGHFNNLGIDTEAAPPESSNLFYQCVGGTRDMLPCQAVICLGGSNDLGVCTSNTDCTGGGVCNSPPTGRGCPSGTCTAVGANLGSLLRLDPAESNLYDDGYTALEVWIEANRSQTDLALHDNLGDWAGLLNQGQFKTGIADSDTHTRVPVQSGSPRTFVASSTDDPSSLDANTVALNVNAGRAVGSGGPFVRATLTGALAATASHALGDPLTVDAAGGGTDTVSIHVEAPTWVEYDTIEIYANSVPNCQSEFTFLGVINRACDVTPLVTLTKAAVPGPGEFGVTTAAGVSGFGSRQVTDVVQPLTIASDTWVIVVVRGTDGVSKPLFPIIPADLTVKECAGGLNPGEACEDSSDCPFGTCATVNGTLADLTDGGSSPPWNLDEKGQLAMAFTNPLFFDFEGDGFCHGGTACP